LTCGFAHADTDFAWSAQLGKDFIASTITIIVDLIAQFRAGLTWLLIASYAPLLITDHHPSADTRSESNFTIGSDSIAFVDLPITVVVNLITTLLGSRAAPPDTVHTPLKRLRTCRYIRTIPYLTPLTLRRSQGGLIGELLINLWDRCVSARIGHQACSHHLI